jgi:hypothetical protein
MEEAMPPLLIAATTPDAGGVALRTESLEQHFNMRRLAENWQSGKNRFNAPGETLLGAFVNHQLVGVCGINSDPFSPQPRAGAFAISTSANATAAGHRPAAAGLGYHPLQRLGRFSQHPCPGAGLALL